MTRRFKKGDIVQLKTDKDYNKFVDIKNKIAIIHDDVYNYYMLSVNGHVIPEAFYEHELELVEEKTDYSLLPVTVLLSNKILAALCENIAVYYNSKYVISNSLSIYTQNDYVYNTNTVTYNLNLQYDKKHNITNMNKIKVHGIEKFAMTDLTKAIQAFVNSENVSQPLDILYAIAQKNSNTTIYSAVIIYE